jgi:hypothetical protein
MSSSILLTNNKLIIHEFESSNFFYLNWKLDYTEQSKYEYFKEGSIPIDVCNILFVSNQHLHKDEAH